MSLYGVIGYHMIANHPYKSSKNWRSEAEHSTSRSRRLPTILTITPYKETLVPHFVATLIYLSQNYSYNIRGDRSPLKRPIVQTDKYPSKHETLIQCWLSVSPPSLTLAQH